MASGILRAVGAAAQASPGPPQPSGRPGEAQTGQAIRVQVSLVNLFATVRDKGKRIIPNLKKEDFRIFEDNQEQQVAFFSHEVALPVTLGLLIDTSGSERNRLIAEQEAASRFLARVMKKGDEAMVISFGADVDLLSDFTDDRSQLERALQRAQINAPQGGVTAGPLPPSARHIRGTALYDAIYLACREKLAQEAGRKAIVIITDADDQGSKVRLEEAIEAAQRTDTVVHILLVSDPGFGTRPDIAKKIAEETGGRVIEVRSEKKLEEAFDQISEELRSQYTLGYYPTNNKRDGAFRKVKVEAVEKDMRVLARRGYYAPKS